MLVTLVAALHLTAVFVAGHLDPASSPPSEVFADIQCGINRRCFQSPSVCSVQFGGCDGGFAVGERNSSELGAQFDVYTRSSESLSTSTYLAVVVADLITGRRVARLCFPKKGAALWGEYSGEKDFVVYDDAPIKFISSAEARGETSVFTSCSFAEDRSVLSENHHLISEILVGEMEHSLLFPPQQQHQIAGMASFDSTHSLLSDDIEEEMNTHTKIGGSEDRRDFAESTTESETLEHIKRSKPQGAAKQSTITSSTEASSASTKPTRQRNELNGRHRSTDDEDENKSNEVEPKRNEKSERPTTRRNGKDRREERTTPAVRGDGKPTSSTEAPPLRKDVETETDKQLNTDKMMEALSVNDKKATDEDKMVDIIDERVDARLSRLEKKNKALEEELAREKEIVRHNKEMLKNLERNSSREHERNGRKNGRESNRRQSETEEEDRKEEGGGKPTRQRNEFNGRHRSIDDEDENQSNEVERKVDEKAERPTTGRNEKDRREERTTTPSGGRHGDAATSKEHPKDLRRGELDELRGYDEDFSSRVSVVFAAVVPVIVHFAF